MLMDWQKQNLLKEWALLNGWHKESTVRTQETNEQLYRRKFSFEETCFHEAGYNSAFVNEWLDHAFLQHFFARFAPVRAREPVSVGVALSPGAMTVSPTVIEPERDIEPWKFHIQQLVLLKTDERPEYLLKVLPASFLKMGEEREVGRGWRSWKWRDINGEEIG